MSRAPLVWGYHTVLEQSSMAHIYLRMCCCTGVSVDPSLCVLLQCQQPRTWPALCWIPALSATGRTYLLFQRKRRESKPFSTLGETLYILYSATKNIDVLYAVCQSVCLHEYVYAYVHESAYFVENVCMCVCTCVCAWMRMCISIHMCSQ